MNNVFKIKNPFKLIYKEVAADCGPKGTRALLFQTPAPQRSFSNFFFTDLEDVD